MMTLACNTGNADLVQRLLHISGTHTCPTGETADYMSVFESSAYNGNLAFV